MKIRSVFEPLNAPQFLQCHYQGKAYGFIFHNANIYRPAPGATVSLPDPLWGYEIMYCRQGRNTIRSGGVTKPFNKGQIATFSKGQSLRIGPSSQGPSEILCLRFTMETSSREDILAIPFSDFLGLWAGEEFSESSIPTSLSKANGVRYEYLYNKILTQLLPGGYIRWFDFKDAIYQILAFVAYEVFLTENMEDVDNNLLHRVRHAIEHKYTETLSLDDLADLAGKSKTQLCRLFRKSFGTTPIDYQINMRMEQAKRLLAETEISIKEISAMVGFHSPYHFSRQFTKRCDSSPSGWRKDVRRVVG